MTPDVTGTYPPCSCRRRTPAAYLLTHSLGSPREEPSSASTRRGGSPGLPTFPPPPWLSVRLPQRHHLWRHGFDYQRPLRLVAQDVLVRLLSCFEFCFSLTRPVGSFVPLRTPRMLTRGPPTQGNRDGRHYDRITKCRQDITASRSFGECPVPH